MGAKMKSARGVRRLAILTLCLGFMGLTGVTYANPAPTLQTSVVDQNATASAGVVLSPRNRARLSALRAFVGEPMTGTAAPAPANVPGVFNRDAFGLPQNEESVTVCRTRPNIVLQGSNDYRGLLDPEFNFTGWHLSTDGGQTLGNEGLLPSVPLLSDSARRVPSGGDPVQAAGTTNADGTGPGCAFLYAASINFNPDNPDGDANGIGLYRSRPRRLANCDTGYPDSANPRCWPRRRLIAESAPGHFLDKPWFDVGRSGGDEQVWVAYTDFVVDDTADEFPGSEIFAVRCDRGLVSCTNPIPISVDDPVTQGSDVTVSPDGRVYVTWSEFIGVRPFDPGCPDLDPDTGECLTGEAAIHKMRVAAPGSTEFGPERVIHREDLSIPGVLHAGAWRAQTALKNEVVPTVSGQRTLVVWDACKFRPLNTVCQEPVVKLKYSDDDGATWSRVRTLSQGGDNYFPTLAWNQDVERPRLALAWFTNRYDTTFHNAQAVEYMTMDPLRSRVTREPRRLLAQLNEAEADPILAGVFIGDYIEVAAVGRTAWVGFNANYRSERLLGPLGVEGVPIPQQDNYLLVRSVD